MKTRNPDNGGIVIQQFTFYPPTDFPIGERNLLWCVDYGVLELWTNGDFVARYKYNESRNIYELDMAPQPVEPDLTDLKLPTKAEMLLPVILLPAATKED